MRLELAYMMAGASNAAYFDNPSRSDAIGYLDRLRIFENGTCRGFVGSNDEVVVVSFRGSHFCFNSLDHIVRVAKDWLRNFNVFQYEQNGVRVHAGFAEDLSSVYDDLGNMILDNGGDTKPVLVTGHSAGAALATLAAHSYKLAGLNIHGAYTFASPRVGNRAFAEVYSVPLYRIENMDDLVPHVPLPPLAMKAVDFVIETMADLLMPAFPNLVPPFADKFEYVHCGKLFFIDWDGKLVHSHTIEEYTNDCVEVIVSELLGVDRECLPGDPIPKAIMDPVRTLRTTASIGPQIARGTFEFFYHHPMLRHLDCVKKLLPMRSKREGENKKEKMSVV